jgi:hypothetical protein
VPRCRCASAGPVGNHTAQGDQLRLAQHRFLGGERHGLREGSGIVDGDNDRSGRPRATPHDEDRARRVHRHGHHRPSRLKQEQAGGATPGQQREHDRSRQPLVVMPSPEVVAQETGSRCHLVLGGVPARLYGSGEPSPATAPLELSW